MLMEYWFVNVEDQVILTWFGWRMDRAKCWWVSFLRIMSRSRYSLSFESYRCRSKGSSLLYDCKLADFVIVRAKLDSTREGK